LPVVVAQDGVAPERGYVYILSTNSTLTVVGGLLRLNQIPSGLQAPGDVLLASLARDVGPAAIGVILSGRGADGALGIKAIRKAGGTTFAHYPGAARFPSMP